MCVCGVGVCVCVVWVGGWIGVSSKVKFSIGQLFHTFPSITDSKICACFNSPSLRLFIKTTFNTRRAAMDATAFGSVLGLLASSFCQVAKALVSFLTRPRACSSSNYTHTVVQLCIYGVYRFVTDYWRKAISSKLSKKSTEWSRYNMQSYVCYLLTKDQ